MPSPKGAPEFIPGTKGALGYGGGFDLSKGHVADVFDKSKSIFKDVVDGDTDEDGGEFGGFDLKKLAIMFGLGTAGLGFLIDKTTSDENVRIDKNLINQAKQVDAMAFDPSQEVTTDLGYLSAYRPYEAADGGIIGYGSGGSTDRYILFKGSLRPLEPIPATPDKLKELVESWIYAVEDFHKDPEQEQAIPFRQC